MPDPTPQELAAKAAADAKAKAPVDTTAALAESIKNLEQRTRPLAAAGATPNMDETVPGGKYKNARGVLVDANGREIKDDGSLVHPEQQKVDAFGRLI